MLSVFEHEGIVMSISRHMLSATLLSLPFHFPLFASILHLFGFNCIPAVLQNSSTIMCICQRCGVSAIVEIIYI